MSGIEGKGPHVGQDVMVTAQISVRGGWSTCFTVSCGVVPNGTFPGELTLGRSVFHRWGVTWKGSTGKEAVVLLCFNGSPALHPAKKVPRPHACYTATESPFSPSNIKWKAPTPVDDPAVANYINHYVTQFRGLFDQSRRKTDLVAKTEHSIDTGANPPVRSPPKRCSPSQEHALRDFVKNHNGSII
ncbi:hypothetical protein K470DRAFT_263171 [Piedraia hortae CBS 480.64]|uniref:Uncharacterized protein n=1 Tax=Piedraia hortae CBS 480.64 TaxID=1314780 RepID=A0A6A7C3H4_9PEZI|nr:hypothetical protein K470DRAFT_263171 [Piedraia hortae CBS 480.64]